MKKVQSKSVRQMGLRLSRKGKIDAMIEFLTTSHLEADGGYPYDYTRIGDVVVIAGLHDGGQDNETEISQYKEGDLVKWYDRAVRYLMANEDAGLGEAIWETAAEEVASF